MGERVGIFGSRRYPDLGAVRRYVMEELADDDTVVTGGAWGVDAAAEKAARDRGLAVEVHRPNTKEFGRRAYAIRNNRIVVRSHRLVAFWDGESRGTQMTMRMAWKAKKACQVKSKSPQIDLFEGEEL